MAIEGLSPMPATDLTKPDLAQFLYQIGPKSPLKLSKNLRLVMQL
jgi:hypothetical protein